jgi:hypothetical protein
MFSGAAEWAGLTIVSHVAARRRAVQCRRSSPENRLRFPVSSRAAHSIQKQNAPVTNHKEYGFKQSSA